jgi:hypothetical protein
MVHTFGEGRLEWIGERAGSATLTPPALAEAVVFSSLAKGKNARKRMRASHADIDQQRQT